MHRFAPAVPVLLLATLVAASLGVSLRGGFVWDDGPLIVDNRRVQDPAEMGKILTDSFWETGDRHDRFRSFFRPLVSLSYAADHALWGLDPVGFHLTNLLLHFVCCLLVYRIALGERLPSWAALAGAGLFAVHPVHVESVAWISGRTDLLCGLFFLAAFAAHRRAEGSGPASPVRVLSLSLYALALFSKEMAATLPVLVFADRWIARRGEPDRFRGAWRACWPYLVVLAAYLVARQWVLGAPGPGLFSLSAASWAATAVFVFARYTILLLLPVGLDAHYPYSPLESLADPLFLVSGAILVVAAAAGLLLWRRSPRAAFWLLWIFLGLTPVLTLGRFGDVLMADRFLYIPSAGLALSVALAAAWLRRGAIPAAAWKAVACAGLVAGLLLAGASWRRSLVWRDDLTLFRDMARTSPESALVRNNLGLALYHRGEFAGAVAEFRLATRLGDRYALAHNNLAAALERNGALEEALVEYRRALEIAPGLFEASANVGNLMVRLGHRGEGLALLRWVVDEHPRSAPALYALASALDFAGRSPEAMPYLERARAADEDHAQTWYLLGKIHHEGGRDEEAVRCLRRFLELWPTSDDTHAASARRVIREAGGRI